MPISGVELVRLSPTWKEPLLRFFASLGTADRDRFAPHPFTSDAIERILQTNRSDLYYVLVLSNEVLAYGMLRGWDEGFEIPSLGIVVHPQRRGAGLASMLMHFLHAAARLKGASAVRLRVNPSNSPAISLYKKLGYSFDGTDTSGLLVGYFRFPS